MKLDFEKRTEKQKQIFGVEFSSSARAAWGPVRAENRAGNVDRLLQSAHAVWGHYLVSVFASLFNLPTLRMHRFKVFFMCIAFICIF